MRTAFTIIILLLLTATFFGQLPKNAMKKMGQNPVLFIDSTEVDMTAFQALNQFDISNISIVKPKKAKKLLGDKGVDGGIYVTTIKSAKQSYWNFLSTKSEKYKQLIPTPIADTTVQYILNGQALSDSSATGTLFLLTDKNFKSLDMIDKEDGKFLMDNAYPKRYIVIITAKRFKGQVKTKPS
ncbi:hypothetical protein KJS94_15100 [Flavihumibacter rivuli]|uniref:hypothetical protein n=1 Tax=Flavihumibacter rivuli TaxID=2838156 RepID=UPI001BDE986B|nr:hypothetical protein [Flavihumibacter rivuli]ULQ55975.1 hypothetical protein KJS94_15100 [Flavihumibacter rivuli]